MSSSRSPRHQGGTASFPVLSLPDAPVLYGVPVSAQVLTIDALAPPGHALSRGLRLRLDR